MKDIYIGQRKIVKTTVGGKTYLGKDRLKIEFDDDSTLMLPQEVFDRIKTDSPIDLTTLQSIRLRSITQKIVIMMTEEWLRLSEEVKEIEGALGQIDKNIKHGAETGISDLDELVRNKSLLEQRKRYWQI